MILEKVNPKSKIGRAYEIFNEMKAGRTSDDERISIRMIMRCIDTAYPFILQSYLDEKTRNDEPVDAQLFSCYQLCFKEYDCDRSDNFVARRAKLPAIANGTNGTLVSFFGTNNRELSFTKAKSFSEAVSKSQGGLYQPKSISYYMEAGYAYMIVPTILATIDKATVCVVPENPSETVTGVCFDIWSSDYSIKGNLWARTKEYILRFDASIILNGMQGVDMRNNSSFSNEVARKLDWALNSK